MERKKRKCIVREAVGLLLVRGTNWLFVVMGIFWFACFEGKKNGYVYCQGKVGLLDVKEKKNVRFPSLSSSSS